MTVIITTHARVLHKLTYTTTTFIIPFSTTQMGMFNVASGATVMKGTVLLEQNGTKVLKCVFKFHNELPSFIPSMKTNRIKLEGKNLGENDKMADSNP